MMGEAELASWLRLLETPGVGGETARRLLAAFGLPEQVFEQSATALERVVPTAVARALHQAPAPLLLDLLARTRDWLAEPGHHLLALGDADYPPLLLQTADPPPLLYASGRLELLNGLRRPDQNAPAPKRTAEGGNQDQARGHAWGRALAIVGSRNPSAQGERDAHDFARDLSAAGVTIVSGMARGVDAQAHLGALLAAEQTPHTAGATIAVLGTGCDRVYPAAHRDLAHRIATHGLLLSEFALGTTPARGNFPRRNRIISGLASGVLVTEAAVHSGSLITARLAAEQGREVFAIPGSIHNPMSRGCHRLLRDGAKLVECVDDVLSELRWTTPQAPPAAAQAAEAVAGADADAAPDATSAAARELLDALGYAILSFDDLAARTGRSAQWLGEQLLELELQGRVARLPGARYQRIERA
jgi:DNA processing protein